jgi:hypothetical protein
MALDLGKGAHLTLLQRARARLDRASLERSWAEQVHLVSEAEALLGEAGLKDAQGGWASKHMRERERLLSKAKELRRQFGVAAGKSKRRNRRS